MLAQTDTSLVGYDNRPRAAHVWDAWEGNVRVSDKVLSTIVFIGHAKHGGSFVPFGTGFLAIAETNGRLFQHIVTVRHVIEDYPQKEYCIRVNKLDGRVEHTFAKCEDWVFHPDKNVDLAALPSHVAMEEYDIKHIHIERELATPELIAEHQIGPGDDVFTAGMFTRHLGEALNRPIVRTGTIAAMPSEPIDTINGMLPPSYLVEVRSIAGLSGSPVFVHMAPLRVMPNGDVKPTIGKTHYFIGVMQGHFQTSDATDIVSPDERAPGDMNAGVGVVIPGKHVLELMDMPRLKNEREKIAAELRKKSGFVFDSAAPKESQAENPDHKEDFTRLLNAAARKREPEAGT